MDRPSLRVENLTHFCRRVLLLLWLAPLSLTGCFTVYSSGNHADWVEREQILSRRYVVTREVQLSRVAIRWFPLGFGRPATHGEITLPPGSIIRIDGIQHAHADGIDGDAFWIDRIDGVVITHSYSGERVDIGKLPSTDALSPGTTRPGSNVSIPFLAPFPVDDPPWLDKSAIPPAVRPLSIRELALAARDPDLASRCYAVAALAYRTRVDERVIIALIVALNDPIFDVRSIAIDGIRAAGPAAAAATDPLLKRLADPQMAFAELAPIERALAAIGAGVDPRIVDWLLSNSSTLTDRAVDVLRVAPPGAARKYVPQMEAALRRDPRWRDSLSYSRILEAIMHSDPAAAMRILIPEIQNPDTHIAYAAQDRLRYVAEYQPNDDQTAARTNEIVTAFLAATANPNPNIRLGAVISLGTLRGDAYSAMPALEKLRSDHPNGPEERKFQDALECTLSAVNSAPLDRQKQN